MDYDVNKKQAPTYPHICGQCRLGFNTDEEYCNHKCNATGFSPQEPEHLGEDFVAISEAALQRGNRRVELEAQGVEPEEAKQMVHEESINPPQE